VPREGGFERFIVLDEEPGPVGYRIAGFFF